MPAFSINNHGCDTPDFDGEITFYVIVCVFLTAFGGLMFGYDLGISGLTYYFLNFLFEFLFFSRKGFSLVV